MAAYQSVSYKKRAVRSRGSSSRTRRVRTVRRVTRTRRRK